MALVLVGCATGGGGPDAGPPPMTGCDDVEVADEAPPRLDFADEPFQLIWRRDCSGGHSRAFAPVAGAGDVTARLLTLTRYPAGAGPRAYLRGYIDRTAATRVGEPRVFRRERGGEPAYIAEFMLRPGGAERLEYVLHAVARGDDGGAVSATHTFRFPADDADELERLKARQQQWLTALSALLDAFPRAPE